MNIFSNPPGEWIWWVVAAAPKSQKSVSLNSVEVELNSLVSSAADGVYLQRCLEFLEGEEIHRSCVVDNSAALHLFDLCREHGHS